MRIVHVVSSVSAEAGGVARTVLDSALALAADGRDQVRILTYGGGTYDFPWGDSPPPGLEVHFARRTGSEHLANAAMKRLIREAAGAADVLHLHGMWEPLMDFAAKTAGRARRSGGGADGGIGVPYVCSIHGMLDPWSVGRGWLKKRIYHAVVEKRRLSGAGALHFTTAAEMRKSSRWVPEGVKVVVIPCIVDLAGYRELPERAAARAGVQEKWGVPAEARCVLFLSRIHEKKGLDLLIDAMERVDGAHLIVAGTGEGHYAAAMKKRAQERGLNGRAHFVGLVRGAQKVMLYRRAEVMAVPSSQENFGLVFVESLACQTPVLLTEDVDIFDEIRGAGAGIVVRRDAGEIARGIKDLLGDPHKAQTMGQAGRKWVYEALDTEAIVRKWREIYQWVGERGGVR